MKKRNDLRDLIFMSICCILGLFLKALISPITNLVTDLIRMPGGGVAGGICMSFLILGAAMSHRRWAGSFIGFMQGLLALALGMSGYQGVFSVITFTVPGIVTDVTRFLWHGGLKNNTFFPLTTCLANAAASIISNALVFHFSGLTFLLWVAMAASAGLLGGFTSGVLYKRLQFINIGKDAEPV